MLDSEAVFHARVLELGLDWRTFERRGWKTHGLFAFSVNFVPGNSDDQAFVKGVVEPVLGGSESPLTAALRRLFYESYTLAAGELRSKLERGSDDPPRRLPPAERSSRFELLKQRLPGFDFDVDIEPSIHLIELAANMIETGAIKYLSWDLCTTRYQELCATKKDRTWRPDSHGHLKEHDHLVMPQADIASDLKLLNALRRRGVALDVGMVLSFEQHEKVVKWLFRAMSREPPTGYARVSFDQLALADKELWRMAAERTRAGLALLPDGNKPLDVIIPEALSDSTLAMMLMPLPAGRSSGGIAGAAPPRSSGGQAKRQAPAAPNLQRAAKNKRVQPPQSFKGLPTRTKDDKPICYSFNLPGGCPEGKAGGQCRRGVHLCPKCFGPHSLKDCSAPDKHN